MRDDEVIGAIREAVAIRPGDTLVLRLAPSISEQEFDQFCEVLKDKLPDGIKPLVIGGCVEQIGCIRGEA